MGLISNLYMLLMSKRINEAKRKLAEQVDKSQKKLDKGAKDVAKTLLDNPNFMKYLLTDHTKNTEEKQ